MDKYKAWKYIWSTKPKTIKPFYRFFEKTKTHPVPLAYWEDYKVEKNPNVNDKENTIIGIVPESDIIHIVGHQNMFFTNN